MPTAKKKTVKKVAKKTVRKPAKKKAPAKKVARKTAKKPAKKAAPKKKTVKAKRKPNPAFMRPMMPSAELATIVGSGALPRTEITKKVWAYIKRSNLQDRVIRRMINADDNLRRVFGGKSQVNMFEMTKLVNKHLK